MLFKKLKDNWRFGCRRTFEREEYIREEVARLLSDISGGVKNLSTEFKEQYGDVDWDTLDNLAMLASM